MLVLKCYFIKLGRKIKGKPQHMLILPVDNY